MKKLIILMLFFATSAKAQLSFEQIVLADSLKKEVIYAKLLEWTALNVGSAKSAIELADAENATIVAKFSFRYHHPQWPYFGFDGWVKYTARIQAKDGKFRVEISQVEHTSSIGKADVGLIPANPETEKMKTKAMTVIAIDAKKQTNVHFEELCERLKDFLSQKQKDW